MYKPPNGIYWRHIFVLKQIDLCEILAGKFQAIPLVESVVNLTYKIAPFLPRKCPILPGKYYGYNLTISDSIGIEETKFLTPNLPNGIYRYNYRYYHDHDMVGTTFSFNHEVYDVNNADNIMK